MASRTYEIWWDPEFESEVMICADDHHEGKYRDKWEKRHEFKAADWESAKVIRNHLLGFEPYQPEYERYMPDLVRSGRTTRMLKDAIKAHQEGRAVYVVATDKRHQRTLRDMLFNLVGETKSGIEIDTPETLGNLDWVTMRGHGMWPNCEVFVDHWTIESRFSRMLSHLHRWDNKEGPQPPVHKKGDMEALKKELDAGYGDGKVSEIKPPLEGIEIKFSPEKLKDSPGTGWTECEECKKLHRDGQVFRSEHSGRLLCSVCRKFEEESL